MHDKDDAGDCDDDRPTSSSGIESRDRVPAVDRYIQAAFFDDAHANWRPLLLHAATPVTVKSTGIGRVQPLARSPPNPRDVLTAGLTDDLLGDNG